MLMNWYLVLDFESCRFFSKARDQGYDHVKLPMVYHGRSRSLQVLESRPITMTGQVLFVKMTIFRPKYR